MNDTQQRSLHVAIYDYFQWLSSTSVAQTEYISENGQKERGISTGQPEGFPADLSNAFETEDYRKSCPINPGFTRIILKTLEEGFPNAIAPLRHYPPCHIPDLASRYLTSERSTTTLPTNEDGRESQIIITELKLELIQAKAHVETLQSMLMSYQLHLLPTNGVNIDPTTAFPNLTRNQQVLFDTRSQQPSLQQHPWIYQQETAGDLAEPIGLETICTSKNQSMIFEEYKETLDGKQWVSKYEELKEFKEKHGHCKVSKKQNKDLCIWIQNQRKNKMAALIMQETRKLLDSIQFDWGEQESLLSSEQEIELNRGVDVNIPTITEENQVNCYATPQRPIAEVLTEQPMANTMDPELHDDSLTAMNAEEQHLGSADLNIPRHNSQEDETSAHENQDCNSLTKQPMDNTMDPEPHDDSLTAMNAEEQHLGSADSNVPRHNLQEDDTSTHKNQDDNSLTVHLSGDEAIAMNDYIETPNGKKWVSMYQDLKEYRNRHGHCRVPLKEDKKLGQWVSSQRRYYNKSIVEESSPQYNELYAARKRLLDVLEFDWRKKGGIQVAIEDIEWREWMQSFEELKKYKRQHGHFRVCAKTSKTLSIWVWRQRVLHRKWLTNNLSSEDVEKEEFEKHKNLLDNIKFDWRVRVWDSEVNLAIATQTQENIPTKSQEQKSRDWDPWILKYEELKEFKAKYGHCSVPFNFNGNKSLGVWVHNQRKKFHRKNKYNSGSLLHKELREQKQLLNKIQFTWRQHQSESTPNESKNKQTHVQLGGQTPPASKKKSTNASVSLPKCGRRWMTSFKQLKVFKEKYGDFQVPSSPGCYKVLNKWIDEQRTHYLRWLAKDSSLLVSMFEERKRLLDGIKFDWCEQDYSRHDVTRDKSPVFSVEQGQPNRRDAVGSCEILIKKISKVPTSRLTRGKLARGSR